MIEDECWVVSNVTILRDVCIGKECVIGAREIVSKNVPLYSIYTGVLETKIRRRFTDEQIILHEKMLEESDGDSLC